MNSFLTSLQKNYVLVILSLIISLVLTAVMNLNSKKDEKDSYIRAALISVVVSTFTVYIHNLQPAIEEIVLSPPPF